MTYLFIFEDGDTAIHSSVEPHDLDCCDDGILQVLDISDPKNVTSYYNGSWHPVEVLDVKSPD